ncbi:MAG: hypothetical protein GVY11_06360 [Gammaproteobacteria bacterium]|jgi:hypothetical protein|nr:hypothetical protein [Gammaproteobacteria bacterium]
MSIAMRPTPTIALVLAALVCAFVPKSLSAATTEQTIELQPGWNAIHVELQPENDSIEQVFAGIPVASVWRWLPDDRPVAFIQDPEEELLTIDGWYGYFPSNRPESILTNLYTITANQAYLVKLLGDESRELTVEGRPVLRNQTWRPDDFQFTGFHVEPGNEPTFQNWFAGSDAHQTGPIFKLNDSGEWVEVTQPSIETIRSGEAYWVYTEGRSTYQGPMPLSLEFGDRLDFKQALSRGTVLLNNASGLNSEIRIRKLPTDTPVPLALQRHDEVTRESFWPTLEEETTVSVEVDSGEILNLGVNRAGLFTAQASQILEFTNGLGARRLLHVGVDSLAPSESETQRARSAMQADGKRSPKNTRASDPRYAGLWVGVASIDSVSMAQQGGVIPVPVDTEFPLRIMMHVDAAGNVRLLNEVILMWEEGEEVPDEDNPEFTRIETPGRFVLLTDDSLIPNYTGVVERGGEAAGNRISTAAYDFPGNQLDFSGSFGPGGAVFGSIGIDPEFATNPFLHRFHPDHDNLDAQYLNFEQEAYEVTRDIELFFAEEDPEGFDRPEWGDEEVAGTYTEAISGLHRSTIFVSGIFRMRRASDVPLLNQ